MANPVFIADTPTLKAQLRLSGAAQSDSLALINTGILLARLYIYRILGTARVTQLQGFAFTEAATTDNDIARLKANMVELALVRIYLMRTMPILFMDSSGAKREIYNDEGFTRRAEMKTIQEEIERLQLDIDMWILELQNADGVAVGDVQGGVMNTDDTCLPPLPIEQSTQGGYMPAYTRNLPNAVIEGGCL